MTSACCASAESARLRARCLGVLLYAIFLSAPSRHLFIFSLALRACRQTRSLVAVGALTWNSSDAHCVTFRQTRSLVEVGALTWNSTPDAHRVTFWQTRLLVAVGALTWNSTPDAHRVTLRHPDPSQYFCCAKVPVCFTSQQTRSLVAVGAFTSDSPDAHVVSGLQRPLASR